MCIQPAQPRDPANTRGGRVYWKINTPPASCTGLDSGMYSAYIKLLIGMGLLNPGYLWTLAGDA
jgi:hypothetical protein